MANVEDLVALLQQFVRQVAFNCDFALLELKFIRNLPN